MSDIYEKNNGFLNSAGEHCFNNVVDGSANSQHIDTVHVDAFVVVKDIVHEESDIITGKLELNKFGESIDTTLRR